MRFNQIRERLQRILIKRSLLVQKQVEREKQSNIREMQKLKEMQRRNQELGQRNMLLYEQYNDLDAYSLESNQKKLESLGLIVVSLRIRGKPPPIAVQNDDQNDGNSNSGQQEYKENNNTLNANYLTRAASSPNKLSQTLQDPNIDSIQYYINQQNHSIQIPINLKARLRTVQMYKPHQMHKYKFNSIFTSSASQTEIFEDLLSRIRAIRFGKNVCIIAYGQTGSGKTWTMEGGSKYQDKGMIPRVTQDILEYKAQCQSPSSQREFIRLQAEAIEVYLDNVIDLLDNTNISKKSKLASFKPKTFAISKQSDIYEIMKIIKRTRTTGDNEFNKDSSRSHCFVKMRMVVRDKRENSMEKRSNSVLHSQEEIIITLIDLAGSQKWSDKKSKNRIEQASAINSSLTALTSVIKSLANKHKHIPYKNSLLTQLLEDSIKKDTSVTLIVNIRPEIEHLQESVGSLRFGQSASKISLGS